MSARGITRRRLALVCASLIAAAGCGADEFVGAHDAPRGPDARVETFDAAVDAHAADALANDAAAVDAGDPDAATPPGVLELSGDIAPVHDPVVIDSGSRYVLFATGDGIAILESTDLSSWSAAGSVFATKPAWITTTSPGNPNHLWAPHVAHFEGQYHLYYSASTFGSNESCIGHATTPSLEPATWVDDGAAVICSTSSDNFNAIDPAVTVDATGRPWLAFGSFWSGLKVLPLEDDGTRQGTELYSVATRPNTAVEAPFLFRRGDYYYLFESVDYCCQGASSTYKIMVGRSANVTGPYADRVGNPLLSGGGTLVLEGGDRWRGPGHNAILETADGDYNVYHAYDADNGGVPTLRISRIEWSADEWPLSAGP